MGTFKTAILRALLLTMSAGLTLSVNAACGDDSSSSSNNTRTKKPRANARAAPPKPGLPAAGAGYRKVADELRHEFSESDFVPDGSGATNRDPFRSWILNVPEIDREGDEPTPVDICTEGNVRWGAPSYSVRDLELIGLVKRGRSFAQFTDRSEKDSWIVRKGDCIGQEKAIIEEVGVGYVRLSITPPAPPGAPAPPAQKQDISLHPDELEIPDSIVSDFETPDDEKKE